MTRNTFSLHLKAIFCLAFLIWAVADAGWASDSVITNQTSPPGAVIGSPVLTNAEQVHWLTRKEAAGGQLAQIRGVITCALPAFNAAVIQDSTAGIYVDRWDALLGEL